MGICYFFLWFLWNIKAKNCSKKVGDVDLVAVANLSWAWWVNDP